MGELKRTPLYEEHIKAGARMVEFSDFEMPVQYVGVIKEHLNTRENVSLFDVSHMGEILVEGKEAAELLQKLTANDISKMYDGRAQYSILMNENGGAVDDIVIYRFNEEKYFICVNAANREKDFNWISSHNDTGATVLNLSDEYAQIAVQGPKSIPFLEEITGLELSSVKFYHFLTGKFPGDIDTIYSRTGYTGEKGFELYISPDKAVFVWNFLLEKGEKYGILPAGLGARDTLRLEMGYPLYGHELTDEITPLEAGLDRFVKLEKGNFFGRETLLKQKEGGLRRKIYPIIIKEKGIPREGYKILVNSVENGYITSGTISPVLKRGIGVGMIENIHLKKLDEVDIIIRDKNFKAIIWETPFVKKK